MLATCTIHQPTNIADRNTIVTQLFNCTKFNECLKKIRPVDIQDDLRSEVMMIILQQPPGRIEMLYQHGKLSFFAIRVLLNTVSKSGTTFSKLFMMRNAPESEIPQLQYEELNGRVVHEAEQEPVYETLLRIKELAYQKQPVYLDIPNVNWYKQYILSLYMKLGTYRKIEDETGIPWESCYKTVKETMIDLRKLAAI